MKNQNILIVFGLVVGLLFAYLEVAALRTSPLDLPALLTPLGTIALVAYVLLYVAGVYCFSVGLGRVGKPTSPIGGLRRSGRFGWLSAGGLILLFAWLYLYSPWQTSLPGLWAQLVVAAGVTGIVSLLLAGGHSPRFGWTELALTLALFLFPRIVHELRDFTDLSSTSRFAAALGYLLVAALTVTLYHPLGEALRLQLLKIRARLGNGRHLMVGVAWLLPMLFYFAAGATSYFLLPNSRFLILLLAVWLGAFLTCERSDRVVSLDSLAVNSGVLVLVSALNAYLLLVIDYPFSLTWSEGNRFYDYSLVFGQSRYLHGGPIVDPYNTPGRYGLWGVLFLWRDSPIWTHRLWNLILQTFPPLLFAALVTRGLRGTHLRARVGLWIALFFIVLAPLHPPFMLASALTVVFAFEKSPIWRGASLLLAGAYVGLSRFTWALAPGAVGGLIDLLLYYPNRQGHWLRRLIPTLLLMAAGTLPGLLRNFSDLQATAQGDMLVNQHPLLWYRLLPNNILGPGVLLLALLYTTPLLVLLAWWMLSGRWRLDWIQKTAIWATLAGFFAAGLVISTKIGGGGDLHNLDMYLITLTVVVVLGLTELARSHENIGWPGWAVALVVALVLFPAYGVTQLSRSAASNRLDVPEPARAETTLSTIRAEVDRALEQGEVLFMDQRQLLTFGSVRGAPLVPEYEKKLMMDHALGSDQPYFQPYYRDLAARRFALIITEPLKINFQGAEGAFAEENDLWVTWVSAPTLCFYEPIFTDKDVGVQLLAPRSGQVDCEKFMD